MNARPMIVTEDTEYDALTSFDSTPVTGARLAEGMLLVDPDLGTPVYLLDHRKPSRQGGLWLVFNYEANTWTDARLLADSTYPVATGLMEG